MRPGIGGGAEEAVAISCDILTRVLPPCFRIGAETEQIAVYRRLCP